MPDNKLSKLTTINEMLSFARRHTIVVVKAIHSDNPNLNSSLVELFDKQLKQNISYAWIDLSLVDFSGSETRLHVRNWMSQLGLRHTKTLPPGYYLFRDGNVLGYHPGTVDPQVQALLGLFGGIGALLIGFANKDSSKGLEFFVRSFEMAQAANLYQFFSRRLGREEKWKSSQQRGKQQRQVYRDELSKAYKLLGVSHNATFVQIKKARLELLKRYHPDKNRENFDTFNRLTQEINEAYQLIVDGLKRDS